MDTKDLKTLIREFKLEYYELLHKHGYADFKLDEPEKEEYTKDEVWLADVYKKAFTDLITKAQVEARIDENEGWFNGVAGRYPLLKDAIPRRISELAALKEGSK